MISFVSEKCNKKIGYNFSTNVQFYVQNMCDMTQMCQHYVFYLFACLFNKQRDNVLDFYFNRQ